MNVHPAVASVSFLRLVAVWALRGNASIEVAWGTSDNDPGSAALIIIQQHPKPRRPSGSLIVR